MNATIDGIRLQARYLFEFKMRQISGVLPGFIKQVFKKNSVTLIIGQVPRTWESGKAHLSPEGLRYHTISPIQAMNPDNQPEGETVKIVRFSTLVRSNWVEIEPHSCSMYIEIYGYMSHGTRDIQPL